MDEILTHGFTRLGLDLPPDALRQFREYSNFLDEKNQVMNLTAITDPESVARLHFLDCVVLLALADFKDKTVIDIGSGAGFPGLPLKIACPELEITLLDSLRKRVSFLEETVKLLGLRGVTCIQARAEEAARETRLRDGFDIVVARAVSRLNVLCELCLPFVKPGGIFIAMKGPGYSQELSESAKAIENLGGKFGEVMDYIIPGTDIRHAAIIISKVYATPDPYPRRMTRIKKSPL